MPELAGFVLVQTFVVPWNNHRQGREGGASGTFNDGFDERFTLLEGMASSEVTFGRNLQFLSTAFNSNAESIERRATPRLSDEFNNATNRERGGYLISDWIPADFSRVAKKRGCKSSYCQHNPDPILLSNRSCFSSRMTCSKGTQLSSLALGA